MCIQSLSWEEPLEKEMATHSSILFWEISWTKESGRLQSKGLQELDMNEVTLMHAHSYKYIYDPYIKLRFTTPINFSLCSL